MRTWCFGPYLRVGCMILLARGSPLAPTKDAGRGRELRRAAGWLAFRACGSILPLAFRGWGSAVLLGMELKLAEVDREVEVGPC